jgi:hypothetical protein
LSYLFALVDGGGTVRPNWRARRWWSAGIASMSSPTIR